MFELMSSWDDVMFGMMSSWDDVMFGMMSSWDDVMFEMMSCWGSYTIAPKERTYRVANHPWPKWKSREHLTLFLSRFTRISLLVILTSSTQNSTAICIFIFLLTPSETGDRSL